jgi:ABC-type dipeptide/oligopeptide/nickel transport system permease component
MYLLGALALSIFYLSSPHTRLWGASIILVGAIAGAFAVIQDASSIGDRRWEILGFLWNFIPGFAAGSFLWGIFSIPFTPIAPWKSERTSNANKTNSSEINKAGGD